MPPDPHDPREKWVFERAHWHANWQARCAEFERLIRELDAKLDTLERKIEPLLRHDHDASLRANPSSHDLRPARLDAASDP